MNQGSAVSALLVAAWLLALGARTRVPSDLAPLRFDALQVALVLLTLLAAGALFDAVRHLGSGPEDTVARHPYRPPEGVLAVRP